VGEQGASRFNLSGRPERGGQSQACVLIGWNSPMRRPERIDRLRRSPQVQQCATGLQVCLRVSGVNPQGFLGRGEGLAWSAFRAQRVGKRRVKRGRPRYHLRRAPKRPGVRDGVSQVLIKLGKTKPQGGFRRMARGRGFKLRDGLSPTTFGGDSFRTQEDAIRR
jgi:hypothetical protein